ncbi:MAG: protease modulator HflC [Alphaproteobacteria bacterium]|nr:protease modulator HflC [Alphaproteobacteria bacterium]
MNRSVLVIAGIALAVVVIIAGGSLFTVQEGRQALVLRLGDPIRVITDPGLKAKWPAADNVVYFEKRVLDFDAERAEMATADQKQVEVDAFARYRIVDPLRFYQTGNSNERVLNQRLASIIGTNLRTAIAEVPLAQVLTEERARLMQRIAENVNVEAKTFGITVIDVRIKRVDLPDENSEAIFRRMQSQREQEARRIRAEGAKDAVGIRADADKRVRVIVAEAQKRSQILRGEGESEATKIYNEAYLKDPVFFDFFRSMQAMSKGLGGDSTRYVGPPDGEFFRYFGSMGGTSPKAAPPP